MRKFRDWWFGAGPIGPQDNVAFGLMFILVGLLWYVAAYIVVEFLVTL